ncbi:hypothetical protein F5148DRAFT_464418 [Russula earlei]|uniref:Uncharacterized protein n=1 Tax=Russula earlei TaxID=71964 RepID=A0ACC0UMW0_9AGAM|nr:hypothetical protein F5148DRAFT_464418 [Russula earlei]
MSILRSNPSARDAKSYLASFGARPRPVPVPLHSSPPVFTDHQGIRDAQPAVEEPKPSPIVTSILDPVQHRTALVKIQGPFTDRQLDSIARGMVYLQKLGLVSVIVVEQDQVPRGEEGEREVISEETMRVVEALEKQGARTRPVLGAVVRLGPFPGQDSATDHLHATIPEAHAFPSDLAPIRFALRAGEIPVLSPLALDSFCRSTRVDANDVIAALARGMVEAAELERNQNLAETITRPEVDVDLTPMRLMIINREGGVPSYARYGLPHLLVNLDLEYKHIHDTFEESWKATHPTALQNLELAHTCLSYILPPSSSAIMVNHRAPSSLIGNLITNKPAVSSSLPHALLQGNRSLTPNTPTLLRRGLSVEVIRDCAKIDKVKMTRLLEQSFGRVLDSDAFYTRLEENLDFVIILGDYAAGAIVTRETSGSDPSTPIVYLDKFAVLPSHQGDGTVDFLWVALHDETYGLGLPFSSNVNGGKEGRGEGKDLVWRSRSNNPVNKWYFERSSGHVRMGDWVLFWCDAEKRLKTEEGRRASAGLSYVEEWEHGRLARWTDIVPKVPSSWKK